MNLVVRPKAGDPLDLTSMVRAEVNALDKDLPLAVVSTLEQAVSQSVALPRLYLTFIGFFAIVAASLAAVGIYGVTSFAVNQRRQEIGVRMALGARAPDVLRLVLGRAMMLSGLGVAIGCAAALALAGALRTLLFDLSPTDPATFVSIALLLAGVALVASWIPARRAMRLDPVALRIE
jgi:putative ABC transport system permease protein